MIPRKFREEDFIYEHVPPKEVLLFREEFYQLLEDFALTIKMDAAIEVNSAILSYICTRVDQRKDYYLYYHSTPEKIMHIAHEKEMGLWAFWVSKYKPIRFVEKVHEQLFFTMNGCTVSDAFAAYLVISIVCDSNNARAAYFDQKRVSDLYYDFANRDFSKEAVISRIEDLMA